MVRSFFPILASSEGSANPVLPYWSFSAVAVSSWLSSSVFFRFAGVVAEFERGQRPAPRRQPNSLILGEAIEPVEPPKEKKKPILSSRQADATDRPLRDARGRRQPSGRSRTSMASRNPDPARPSARFGDLVELAAVKVIFLHRCEILVRAGHRREPSA